MVNDESDGHTPAPPRLGAAADHRAAADQAARQRDFDRAVRERFRAVLRGLEQGGTLEVRRSRTAQETADDASTALPPPTADELRPAASVFDEVVYGGRRATEDEYRRLEYADHYSAGAPPPAPEPAAAVEAVSEAPAARRRRQLPAVLRDPRFWGGLVAILATLLLVYAALQACSAPTAPPSPPPPTFTPPPQDKESRDTELGPGRDSIFEKYGRIAFGGVQFAVALGLLMWWRGRRRGALVGEPRPVEVAANELLAGQAALYRRSRDYDHVAGKLRTATLRRIRPLLGMTADTPPHRLVAAVAARTGTDTHRIGAALFGPVPDAGTLEVVAAQLAWIEQEVG